MHIQETVRPLHNAIQQLLERAIPSHLSCKMKSIAKILALIIEKEDSSAFGSQTLVAEINQNLQEFLQRENRDTAQMMEQERSSQNIVKTELKKFQNSQKSCEKELSIACETFYQQLASLSKHEYTTPQPLKQKQNHVNLKDTLVFQLLQDNIANLRNKISDYMLVLTTNSQQAEKNCHLLSCQEIKNQKHSKSSVRSLLTEKLKQIQLEYNEDDLMNSPNHGAIKGNWILKEMKTNAKNNQSADVKNCNFSQPDYDNFRSQQVLYELNHKKGEIRRFQSHRIILGEINLQESERKQRKVKDKESGCARCEIY